MTVTVRIIAIRIPSHTNVITTRELLRVSHSQMTAANETVQLVSYRGPIYGQTVIKNRAWESCS